MTDLAATVLTITGLGFALILIGGVIAINTSAGGTRSDYDDNSGFFCRLGAAFIVLAFIIGIVGIMT